MGILGCGVVVCAYFFFPLVIFFLPVLVDCSFGLVFFLLFNLGYIKETSYFSRICLG